MAKSRIGGFLREARMYHGAARENVTAMPVTGIRFRHVFRKRQSPVIRRYRISGPTEKTTAIRPFNKRPAATETQAPSAQARLFDGWPAVSLIARWKPWIARVTARVSATSGISIRVKSQRPQHVARLSP